jgi:hypothetical protein
MLRHYNLYFTISIALLPCAQAGLKSTLRRHAVMNDQQQKFISLRAHRQASFSNRLEQQAAPRPGRLLARSPHDEPISRTWQVHLLQHLSH